MRIADVQAGFSSYETDEITEEDFRLQLEDAVLHSQYRASSNSRKRDGAKKVGLAARHSEIYEYLEARELKTYICGSGPFVIDRGRRVLVT